MFDGIIKFDQEHKKIENNIKAVKEKMANMVRELLKA